MTKLFISYAHADSEIVLNISERLQEAGYELWIDKFGIQGGDEWTNSIVKGIKGCDIFLLFISSKSILSDFVRRELHIAFDEKIKIIPVLIEHVDTPDGWDYQLAGIQYIDHRGPDWKSRLLTALSGQSARQPITDTGKLRNPYSSLPVLEPIERTLILANREKELSAGFEYLKEHRLLLVTGMPGIGKSTFARALLELLPADSLPPFWYNFERQRSSGNTLGVLLDRISSYLDICLNAEVRREVMAFRDSPAGQASVNDVDVLIGFLNQEKPIWLVFDNLETVLSRDTSGFLDEGLETLFDSLKNNTKTVKIIITNPFIPIQQNGERFLEAGTQALTLTGLDNASAIAFLQAYGLQDLPKNKLASLLQDIDGHPFLLNHIAHYIQAIGISAAMDNLEGGLEESNERFGGSLKQRLSSQEFNALQSLTILNREISLAGLCQVAQVNPEVILRLREKGLLQTNDTGKFWLHNIVRNSLKLTDLDAAKQANLRAMNFYRGQEMPLLRQSIDDYTNVLEWHHHAVEAGEVLSAYSALYSTGMEDQLMKWNEYDLLARLGEQIIAMANPEQNSLSTMEQIKIHRTLGTVYFYMGNFTRSIAYLKRAATSLPFDENQELRISLLIELSESYNGNRDFALAMELCQEAIEILVNRGEDRLQAKALHLRGIINRDKGDLERAADDLEKALKLYENLNDQMHIAPATGDLGLVYYYQNRFEEAVANYQRAIISYAANQDLRGVMIAHSNIGDIMLQEEQYGLAEKELDTTLQLARKKKIVSYELDAGLSLVESWIALSQFNKAEEELNILERLVVKQTSPCISGRKLFLSASLYWKRKQPDLAKDFFRRGLEELENEYCRYERARACLLFATFLREQGQIEEAKDVLQKAKIIFTELNNHLGLRAVEKRYESFSE